MLTVLKLLDFNQILLKTLVTFIVIIKSFLWILHQGDIEFAKNLNPEKYRLNFQFLVIIENG